MIIKDFNKPLKIVFFVSLAILLIPIWQNKFFLTNDGPSHLYNAAVIKDWILGNNIQFYEHYYVINSELEPNWFTHGIYALLQTIFPAFLSEKIVLTAYVLGFVFALRSLLHTINPKSQWLIILGMPLLYQKIFLMGFFNCAFSYVFFFIVLNYWLKRKDKLTILNGIVITLLLIFTYFTHPMGLLLSLVSIAIIFLVSVFPIRREKNWAINKLKNGVIILLASLPSVWLMWSYMARSAEQTLDSKVSGKALYHRLIEGDFLFNLSYSERGFAMGIAVCFGITFFAAVFYKVRAKKVTYQDAFGALFVFSVIIYFNMPAYLAGGGFFVERLQFIIYLLLLLWLATVEFDKRLKVVIMGVVAVCSTALIILRVPIYYQSSKAVEEYLEVVDYIADESTVLPLSYNHAGCNIDGTVILNHFWLFMHIGDYIGTEKKVVTLANYEANTGYFPLNYREEVNPFWHLGNMEGQPPNPDILEYPERTQKGTIDYVVLWCFDMALNENESVVRTMQTLDLAYDLVYKSSHERAWLYRRKGI